MRKSLLILGVGVFLMGSVPAFASTPDGQTPSRETVCDLEQGAAYGLCTAYCEAMDCESPDPHASATACSRVGSKFLQITGRPVPCGIACPCERLPLFASIFAGGETLQGCSDSSSGTSVSTTGGAFASVTVSETEGTCSDNAETMLVITVEQAQACRSLLVAASASQSVACVSPE